MTKEKFFKKFPASVDLGHRCFVDDDESEDCVWDVNRPNDCSMASQGVKKLECEYWQMKTTQAFYTSDEIWEWIKNINGE
jgi:hypothetical protein